MANCDCFISTERSLICGHQSEVIVYLARCRRLAISWSKFVSQWEARVAIQEANCASWSADCVRLFVSTLSNFAPCTRKHHKSWLQIQASHVWWHLRKAFKRRRHFGQHLTNVLSDNNVHNPSTSCTIMCAHKRLFLRSSPKPLFLSFDGCLKGKMNKKKTTS